MQTDAPSDDRPEETVDTSAPEAESSAPEPGVREPEAAPSTLEADSADTPEPDPPFDDPASVSALDRRQSGLDASGDDVRSFSLSWIGGVAFVLLGIIAVWFWVNRAEAPATDLLRHAVEVAPEFRPVEITDDPDRAAAFILEQFQIVTAPPDLDGFILLGVGPAELAPGVVVPAYRYDGAQSATVVVFSYDYPLLDEASAEGVLTLAPEVYARLAEPEPVDSRRQGDAYTVTWRRRSTLYTAVAPGQEVAERILQSVRRPEI